MKPKTHNKRIITFLEDDPPLTDAADVTENMIGHKFGEFSPTRQFYGHTSAEKKAKDTAATSEGAK